MKGVGGGRPIQRGDEAIRPRLRPSRVRPAADRDCDASLPPAASCRVLEACSWVYRNNAFGRAVSALPHGAARARHAGATGAREVIHYRSHHRSGVLRRDFTNAPTNPAYHTAYSSDMERRNSNGGPHGGGAAAIPFPFGREGLAVNIAPVPPSDSNKGRSRKETSSSPRQTTSPHPHISPGSMPFK